MPTPPKLAGKQAARTTVKRAPVKRSPKAAPKPQGRFARIKAEAAADRGDAVIEPYVIDDVDPPIVIESPETADQITVMGEMLSNEGRFTPGDARRVLQAICGDTDDTFDRLWDLVRHEHISVLVALIHDMGEHFRQQGAELVTEEEFPGGTGASSD